MKQLKLGRPRRRCCGCGRDEAYGAKDSKRVNMVALSSSVYRRGSGKGAQRGAGSVQICDECYIASIRAVAPNVQTILQVWAALAERLRPNYSSLLEEQS